LIKGEGLLDRKSNGLCGRDTEQGCAEGENINTDEKRERAWEEVRDNDADGDIAWQKSRDLETNEPSDK